MDERKRMIEHCARLSRLVNEGIKLRKINTYRSRFIDARLTLEEKYGLDALCEMQDIVNKRNMKLRDIIHQIVKYSASDMKEMAAELDLEKIPHNELIGLATRWEKAGENSKAKVAYEHLLANDCTDDNPYNRLIIIYKKVNNYHAAYRVINDALRMLRKQPDDTNFRKRQRLDRFHRLESHIMTRLHEEWQLDEEDERILDKVNVRVAKSRLHEQPIHIQKMWVKDWLKIGTMKRRKAGVQRLRMTRRRIRNNSYGP